MEGNYTPLTVGMKAQPWHRSSEERRLSYASIRPNGEPVTHTGQGWVFELVLKVS